MGFLCERFRDRNSSGNFSVECTQTANGYNMASFIALLTIFLFFITTPTKAAKIVGLPMFGGSQYIGMKRIAQELVTRGHQVTILVSSIQTIKPTQGIIHAVYKVPYEKEVVEKFVSSQIEEGVFTQTLFGNITMPQLQASFCDALISNKQLIEPLKDFDLLVTDSSMACGHVLSDYLEIKRVDYCPVSPRFMNAYNPYETFFQASYVPRVMSFNPGKMNFLQRVKNTLLAMATATMFSVIMARPLESVKVKYKIKPDRRLFDSEKDSQLVLFLSDFALEYTYPIPPHYKMIGPVNIQPAKPLPPDLQQLVDKSGDDGSIIVSFGSNMASSMAKDKVDIMAEAFGRLKQLVIWRIKGYIPSSLSPNIKPVSWLPQNDLLSHKNLRLFVSHVGQNSLYEAAYRGVPLVAIPLFADQFDNAFLMESRKIGLSLDYFKLTADQLHSTIEHVIKEPSYRQNVQRISRLMQDRPRSPVQEAGDWIEYALRHESLAHLRPYSDELSWYQYFLVDVAVFLVLVVLVVIMVVKYTVRLMCWMCCRRDKKQKIQ